MFSLRMLLIVTVPLAVACGGESDPYVYSPPEIEMDITGTVLAGVGQPIEGALIALWDGDGLEGNGVPFIVYYMATFTAADGSYRMDRTACGIEPGDIYYLTASKQGYQTASNDPTSCFQEVNFVLRPESPSASSRR